MGKKKKKSGPIQRDHSGKTPKNPGDPNFTALTKSMYRCIQLGHHRDISQAQQKGKLTRGFQAKVRDLKSFLKPACPTDKLAADLDSAHNAWVSSVTAILTQHYKDELAKYSELVKSSTLPLSEFERAQTLAISWGRKNFRSKLSAQTLAEFQDICKEFNSDTATTSGETVLSIEEENFPYLAKAKTPPSSPATPRTSSRPKRRLSISPTSSPPSSESLAKKVKSVSPVANTSTPEPVVVSVSSTGHGKRDWQTQPTKKATIKPLVYDGDKKDWKLPELSKPTLVLGDSNLAGITKTRVSQIKDLEVLSYRGGQFFHLSKMLKKSSPQRHVTKLILSVGINERNNYNSCRETYNCNAFLKEVRRVFPEAKIFFASPQWQPELLNSHENENLSHLEGILSLVKDITLLPFLERSKFKISPTDTKFGIHWTTETANQMLDCWIQALN